MQGIWIGLIGGVITQTITIVYLIWRTDWDDQVNLGKMNLIWEKLI